MVGYGLWFINHHILGGNLTLPKAFIGTLLVSSLMYLFLGILSYWVEGG